MLCLNCKKDSPDALTFRVLEVHTLHIRDFDGEKVIQALGEFQDYDVCAACASEEERAVLYPAKRIAAKCFPFVLLMIAGTVLSLLLTFREILPAVRALGPLAVMVGAIGTAGKVREILSERESVSKMNRDEAVRYCAWRLVLKNAPKKYEDNDITYIPVNKTTLSMTALQLSEKFNLLPAIAHRAREIIHEEDNNDV